MVAHSKIQPQRTFRWGKYVLAMDSILPSLRTEKLPGHWCTIAELVARFPTQVVQQYVGSAHQLPEYRYYYSGIDEAYYGGFLPATTIPADYLLRIEGGRSFGRHCVIFGPEATGLTEFAYEKTTLSILQDVLPGGRLNPRYWKHALQSMLHQRRLTAVRRWPGTVAALNAPSSHNYFHWMAEILPRLVTLQKSGLTPDWYLVDAYTPFQLQTLEAFGVPLERIIQPYACMHLEAEQLLVPSRSFPNSCREVAAELMQRLGTKPGNAASGRLFINRRDSRLPVNAVDFKRVLHRFGFEEHFLEDYSLPQQIELFTQAEAVVAMHGAGLTNLMFCKPGTFVLELMPAGRRQPCYPILSSLGGLHHHLVTGDRRGFHQDIYVPLEVVARLLDDEMGKCLSRVAA